ncbi:MAG: hypothetical protein IT559_00430 [Alphaproteobacteria bacterium]|nr:hypothetical protein [Alphaproteobacteria bacterium]
MKTSITILNILSVAVLLAGCTLSAPDHFTDNRLQVQEEQFSESIPVSQFDERSVEALAAHFAKHGDGPVELTVTYDPYSAKATARRADEEAVRIAQLLKKNGVEQIKADILPVMDSGDEMRALFSYTFYSALPPADCEVMPGLQGRRIDAQADYKLGCTVDTLVARQIARPKDLLGQKTDGGLTDGRRAANIVERYRTGTPNQPLEGESASDK